MKWHAIRCIVCSMLVFILTPNLNLLSGSGSKIWLNQTPNKSLGSCSNIVWNVWNRTTASLMGMLFFVHLITSVGPHTKTRSLIPSQIQVRSWLPKVQGFQSQNLLHIGSSAGLHYPSENLRVMLRDWAQFLYNFIYFSHFILLLTLGPPCKLLVQNCGTWHCSLTSQHSQNQVVKSKISITKY